VLSFLSPCCLPLVPAYLGHLAGVSIQSGERQKAIVLFHAVVFVSGFSLVFVGFWLSLGLVGYLVQDQAGLIRQVGDVVLLFLGLHIAGVLRIPFLYREKHLMDFRPKGKPSVPSSFLMRVTFAAGWTPCVGPILGSIIGLASMSDTVGQGAALLSVYAAGLGLPFLGSALAIGSIGRYIRKMARYYRAISMVSGALVMGIGVLMLTNTFARLSQYFQWAAL